MTDALNAALTYAALTYAGRGWRVVPIGAGSSPSPAPPNGSTPTPPATPAGATSAGS